MDSVCSSVRATMARRMNSLGKQQLELWLARDLIVHLETAVNLCASRRQGNNFSQFVLFFELGGITKRFMTGPTGDSMTGPTADSEFYFPPTQHSAGEAEVNIEGLGETRLTVSLGDSH